MGQNAETGMTLLLDEIRFSLREHNLRAAEDYVDGVVFFISGRRGEAEVHFGEDGIFGSIYGEVVHCWPIFESVFNVRCAVKKIRDLIG
jgi:hypothetical protein